MYQIIIVREFGQPQRLWHHVLEEMALDCCVLSYTKEDILQPQVINQWSAEIVILDIKEADEELIQAIKQKDEATQVIMIVQDSDWRCAQAAIRSGADAYIPKEYLSREELAQIIAQALLANQERKTKLMRHTWMEKEALRALLLSIETGSHEVQEAIRMLSKSAILAPYQNGYYMAYITMSSQMEPSVSKHIWQRIHLWIKQSHKTENDGHPFAVLSLRPDTGVILFQRTQENVKSICCELLLQFAANELFLTLSEPCERLCHLPQTFKALLQLDKAHFYASEGMLIQGNISADFHALHKGSIDFHDRLYKALNARDYEEMGKIHTQVMCYMKEKRIDPQEVISYVVFLLHNMEGNELKKAVKTGFDFYGVISQIPDCRSLHQLDLLMRDTLYKIKEWLKDEESDRYGKDIRDIILFVEQNCAEKISLHMLAERFHVNESYLSRMFKKQTGKNLIYFINEMKMSKARELLCDPNIMVKEAAYAVGFEDPFYFNKLFKRFYGTSPTEYRRRILDQRTTSEHLLRKV